MEASSSSKAAGGLRSAFSRTLEGVIEAGETIQVGFYVDGAAVLSSSGLALHIIKLS